MHIIAAESTRQVDSETAYADVADVAGQADRGIPWDDMREIRDETAVTIAAWWQSPGTVGREMATLASGLPVDVTAFCEDISRSLQEATTKRDRDALGCLGTWAINHPSRVEVSS